MWWFEKCLSINHYKSKKKGGEFITPALGTPERVSYFFFLLVFFLAAFFLRFAIIFASSLSRG